MKSAVALSLFAASAYAGGVLEAIAPEGDTPAGCSLDYSGTFEVSVSVIKDAAKRDTRKMKRATCGQAGTLVLKLTDGILTDGQDRTGYIASNFQFQFDDPPQAGALYTAGFSVCGDDSLALGGSTTFYQCKSGDFYNLYDRNWAAQCEPVDIIAVQCGAVDADPSYANVVGTEYQITTIVKPLSDGQPQVITTTTPVRVCQIGDGQIQGHTTPCSEVPETATHPPVVPVSQISDGQVQVTPPAATATAPSAPAATPAGSGSVPSGSGGVPAGSGSSGSVPAGSASGPAGGAPGTFAPSATAPGGSPSSPNSPAVTGPATPAGSGSASVSGGANNGSSTASNYTGPATGGHSSTAVPGSGSLTSPGTGGSPSASIITGDAHRASGSMTALTISLFAAYFIL